MTFKKSTVVVVLALFLVPVCAAQTQPVARARPKLVAINFVGVFDREEFRYLAEETQYWRDAPPYQKLALAEAVLLPRVVSKDRLTFVGKAPGIEHDLSITGGRAMWALQELIGVPMPTANAQTMERAPELLKQATAIVKGYRSGLMDANRKDLDAAQLNSLRTAFRERINFNDLNKAMPAGRAMLELLAHWPPLGRKMSELLEIIDWPGKIGGKNHDYKFDNGHHYISIRFVIDEGRIESVLIKGACP